jgi:hypothetical protein
MKTWFLTMSVLAAACGGGGGGGGTPGSSTTPTSTPTHYTKWSIGRFGCGFTHEVVPLPSVIKDRYSTSPEITVVSDEQVWGVGEGETLARVCLDDGGVRVMCVGPE